MSIINHVDRRFSGFRQSLIEACQKEFASCHQKFQMTEEDWTSEQDPNYRTEKELLEELTRKYNLVPRVPQSSVSVQTSCPTIQPKVDADIQ